MPDFPCVNSVLLRDYLYECPACMSLYIDIENAAHCCLQKPLETDGYQCSYCEECSESCDEINTLDHRNYGDKE